jgi:DNA-binding transcriptional LysR family regulator
MRSPTPTCWEQLKLAANHNVVPGEGIEDVGPVKVMLESGIELDDVLYTLRCKVARRRKIDLSELITEPWVLSAPDTANYIGLTEACRARGIDMPKISLEAISNAVRLSLLAAGPYIAALPRSSMRPYADGYALTVLPVDLPTQLWPVALVTLKNRTLSPVVERFLACVREVAKSFDDRPAARKS